jgi:hypothetical protein
MKNANIFFFKSGQNNKNFDPCIFVNVGYSKDKFPKDLIRCKTYKVPNKRCPSDNQPVRHGLKRPLSFQAWRKKLGTRFATIKVSTNFNFLGGLVRVHQRLDFRLIRTCFGHNSARKVFVMVSKSVAMGQVPEKQINIFLRHMLRP